MILEERGLSLTAVSPGHNGSIRHTALAVYPAAPLSAAVAFFFFAICLGNMARKERKMIFSSFKQRHKLDEAETMVSLAWRKFFLAAGTSGNGFFQVPVCSSTLLKVTKLLGKGEPDTERLCSCEQLPGLSRGSARWQLSLQSVGILV